MVKPELENKELFKSGHTACAGCGVAVGLRHIMRALGKDTIVVNATGCTEIFTSAYPKSAWAVPYIHCVFENSAPVAAGISEALRAMGNDHTKVVVISGDGASYDIGFGHMSGMFERGHDVLYICYDNEAYMNTGVQRSGATPWKAHTTTSQVGKQIRGKMQFKKPLTEIVAAHNVPYVATSTSAHYADLQQKVQKAKEIKGPSFLNVLMTCVPGWGTTPSLSMQYLKDAVDTHVWPLMEIENGFSKLSMKPEKKPVEAYLKGQKRFRHLTEEDIAEIQEMIDERWDHWVWKEKVDQERKAGLEASE
ncbi:pyruvate synthase subunit beta [Candidatus Micrarchaeota archaeon]|nr:pyruvate synthase subunit beta [Candidatus Micrarchaeota archaeon]MBD3418260.1 pyruvate synthase subunit beta [Candidatus Micrarchaeota archaeon]